MDKKIDSGKVINVVERQNGTKSTAELYRSMISYLFSLKQRTYHKLNLIYRLGNGRLLELVVHNVLLFFNWMISFFEKWLDYYVHICAHITAVHTKLLHYCSRNVIVQYILCQPASRYFKR